MFSGDEEQSKIPRPSVELSFLEDGSALFNVRNLELEGKDSFEIPVVLKKAAMGPISPSTEIAGLILIGKSPKLERLIGQAQELKNLPLEEKIRQVMALTRSALSYYNSEVREKLKAESSEEAEWLKKSIVGSRGSLAEVVDHGYGICGHFTALGALLSQQAGLEVLLNRCSAGSGAEIVNIYRTDNSRPLFKEAAVGGKIFSHIWYEVLDQDRVIPVDPTVGLVGLSLKEREMFKKARYFDTALILSAEERDVVPPILFIHKVQDPLPVGESTGRGRIIVQNEKTENFRGNLSFGMGITEYGKKSRGGVAVTGLA